MKKHAFFSFIVSSLLITQSLEALPPGTRNGGLIDWITSSGSSGTFSASYGQLSISAVDTHFYNDDEWSAVPFNSTGLVSNMEVSISSPATITVQQAGIYQVNFNLYFSVEESDEDTFTATDYILGLNINGTTLPVSSVHVLESGAYLLSYSDIMELSADDYVQFYMKVTDTDGPTFSNNITFEKGSAYLMQISN